MNYRPHVQSKDCWCNPTVETVEGQEVYLHDDPGLGNPPSIFAPLEEKLASFEAEVSRLVDEGHLTFAHREKQLPEAMRQKLLVLGSALHDSVFWVRRRPQKGDLGSEPGDQMFWAEEIESGTGTWGVSAREALDHYFMDDVLDRRRYTDHRGLDLEYPE